MGLEICGRSLAQIQAVFHVGDHFWTQQNRHPKIKKNFFFQDKFYSSKAHAQYFTVLIYLATWRAAILGIFTHFTSINLPQCTQSINSPMYVYLQIFSCFLWVLDHSRDRTSSYYCRRKKMSVLPPGSKKSFPKQLWEYAKIDLAQYGLKQEDEKDCKRWCAQIKAKIVNPVLPG